jgi:hypothetical protein
VSVCVWSTFENGQSRNFDYDEVKVWLPSWTRSNGGASIVRGLLPPIGADIRWAGENQLLSHHLPQRFFLMLCFFFLFFWTRSTFVRLVSRVPDIGPNWSTCFFSCRWVFPCVCPCVCVSVLRIKKEEKLLNGFLNTLTKRRWCNRWFREFHFLFLSSCPFKRRIFQKA